MNKDIRKNEIYNIIQSRGSVDINYLAKEFNVSGMTIRRDINALEELHLVQRSYGKVFLNDKQPEEGSFEMRSIKNVEGKRHIANLASAFLEDANSIYLDGSTTSYALLDVLHHKPKLTVFTNNIPTFTSLIELSNINAFLFGGMYDSNLQSLDSSYLLTSIKDIFVDVAFVSCNGFNTSAVLNNGITNIDEKRIMIENASTTILLADNSKFNVSGIFKVCNWNDIDIFITDKVLDANVANIISSFGVKILW